MLFVGKILFLLAFVFGVLKSISYDETTDDLIGTIAILFISAAAFLAAMRLG